MGNTSSNGTGECKYEGYNRMKSAGKGMKNKRKRKVAEIRKAIAMKKRIAREQANQYSDEGYGNYGDRY